MAQTPTQHQQLWNGSSSVWKYWNPWKEMESNSAGGVEKPINWPTSSLMCLLPWSSSHPLRTSQLIKSHPHLPTSLAANQTNKSTYQPKQTTYLTTITYQPTWQPTGVTNQPNQPANKNKSINSRKKVGVRGQTNMVYSSKSTRFWKWRGWHASHSERLIRQNLRVSESRLVQINSRPKILYIWRCLQGHRYWVPA